MNKASDAAKSAQAAQRRTLAEANKAEAPKADAPDTTPPAEDTPKAGAPVTKHRARVVTDSTDGGEGEAHQPAKGDKMLTVTVAKAFRLTQDDGAMVQYKVGAQSMPTSHFEHWYAQAHGVTLAK